MAGVFESCSTTDKSQVEASGKIYRTSAIESFITRTKGGSYALPQHEFVVTRSVQFNMTSFLNRNNNGNSKETDSDVETAAAIAGSKSYQGLSKGLSSPRQKPRFGHLRRSHPEVHRSREEGQTRCQRHNTYVGIENRAKGAVQGISRRNQKGADTEVLTSQNPHDYRQLPLLEDIDEIEDGSQGTHATSDASVQTDHLCGPPYFSDLFQEVSLVKSISQVPESVKDGLLLLLCTPLLDGGYQNGGCAWSSLGPAGPNHTRPRVAGCQPFHSVVTEVTDITGCYGSSEEQTPVQGYVDTQAEDPSFTGNEGDRRTESPRSFLHDDFIHEDDVLDIPTLSILSPSRASLGQAYPSGHSITSLSTLDHDEDKPASHEPFPSEYVIKKVCGPSFCVSSAFRHIKIPTLPSDIVDYKVEPDGITEIVIGAGSFGKVFAATLTVSPGQSTDVVVKEHFTDKKTQESIAKEAKITMYLESTGCVPICYGLLSDKRDGYKIVMEYVGTGLTLRDVLCDSRLPGLHWLNIVCQIASGLNKIHKKDVLINDIKSDNILVDMSGTLPLVKFCDMGSASYKSGVTYRGDMKKCVHLAPEACAHAETTAACDVFSLGRVLKKIYDVSHISTLLTVSDMCMAKDPALRPTLWTVNQLLQEEYTKEVLFPTLTVPSHGYLDSTYEESQKEYAGPVLRLNTPVDKDSATATDCSSEVDGGVPDACTKDSKRNTHSAQVSPPNRKPTSRENHELLRASAVLHTERRCKTASVSRIPRFRAQTDVRGSKDTSVSTPGLIHDKHNTTVNTDGPSCCNRKSVDNSSITTEDAEKTADVAILTSDAGQSHECQKTTPPGSSSSAVFAEKTSDVATRKSNTRQSHECHFATPESSPSAVVAEESSDLATRKCITGLNPKRRFAAPESPSSTVVIEKITSNAARKSESRHSYVCYFAIPENFSSAEVAEKIAVVATRIYDDRQSHEFQFATPESSSSTDVAKKTSAFATGKVGTGQKHECHFAAPENSSSTGILKEMSKVATMESDAVQRYECQFVTPESSPSTEIPKEASNVATRKHDAVQSYECQFATPESSPSTEIPKEISNVSTRGSDGGRSHDCRFATTDVCRRSQSPTEALYMADIHCRAELDVQWEEDTTVYEDYLPLVLPLLMLLFGVVGVV